TSATTLPSGRRRFTYGNGLTKPVPLFSPSFLYIPPLSRFPCVIFLKPAHNAVLPSAAIL
ncbi:hypothetical protein, partial [Ectopseudomonas toyotomiensis]|uniref:hypothetical protein n=1 Tax=Ectopseudomonas toyotomiensis TaxID=554344 RepID=UPI0019D45E5F